MMDELHQMCWTVSTLRLCLQ